MSRHALLVAVIVVVTSCQQARSKTTSESTEARNLVLVTVDTLRADRLGCYGNDSVETPHLDRIAREGALVEHASASAPLTLPSHATLLTGRLPPEHGIRDNFAPALPASIPTLAEVLRDAGFETGAFVSAAVLAARTGMDRGFGTYADIEPTGAPEFLGSVHRSGGETVREAVEWLEGRAPGKRWFAWIHLYDPHEPYEPPEPFAARYADRPYEGEVAWSDELVGRIYRSLEGLELLDETLLVVTSDHGEGLGDHDEMQHGFFIYESTLRVPLIVRGPGVLENVRVAGNAQLADVFPTVLEALAVESSTASSGRSLFGALSRSEPLPDALVYAETLVPRLHFGWSELRAIRDGRLKFVDAPRPELYDLVSDPGESRNLVSLRREDARAMHAALARERARWGAEDIPALVPAPRETAEQLAALGYVGMPLRAPDAGADPKDKLDEFRLASGLIQQALSSLRAGDEEAAVHDFLELLDLGIESYEIRYRLGRALVSLGRFAEAETHLEAALRLQPNAAEAYGTLAASRMGLGELEAALSVLARGRDAAPEATLLSKQEAVLRVELGEFHRDRGDLESAEQELRRAVRLDPSSAETWNSLGAILGGSQRWEQAAVAFRKAVELEPRQHLFVFNLGLALLRDGRPEEAARQFQGALEITPGFGAARERLAEISSAREGASSPPRQ